MSPQAPPAPIVQPPWWWQASGLIVGVQIVIRWDDGTFSVQGDPPGWRTAEDILAMFLRDLLYEGEGDGISPVVGPGIALMGSSGSFVHACEEAAKATMPGPIVFDYEFGVPDPDRLD